MLGNLVAALWLVCAAFNWVLAHRARARYEPGWFAPVLVVYVALAPIVTVVLLAGGITVAVKRYRAEKQAEARATMLRSDIKAEPCELGHACSMMCLQVNDCGRYKIVKNTMYWRYTSEQYGGTNNAG